MQTRSGSKMKVRSSWRVLASVGLLAGIVPLACAAPTQSDAQGTGAGADDSPDGKSYIDVYDGVAETMSDSDMDGDGVPNDRDLCPGSTSKADASGCAAGQSPDSYQAPPNAPSFDIPGVDVLGNGFVNLKLFAKGGEIIEFRTLLENIEVLGSELFVKGTLLVKLGDGTYLCLPAADVKFDIDVHGLIDVHGEVSVKIPHLGLLGLICVDADVRAKLDLVVDESECEYPTLIESIRAMLRLQVKADAEVAVGPICIDLPKVSATLLVDAELSNFWFKGPLASPMLSGDENTWMGFSNQEIPTCEEDHALLGIDGAEVAIDGELELGKLGLDIEGHVYVEVNDDECHGGGEYPIETDDGCYIGCDGIERCDAGAPPDRCDGSGHESGCGACGEDECCGSIEIDACVEVDLEAKLHGHEVELEILEAKVEAEIGCDEAKAKIEGHLLHEKGLWPEILPIGLGVDAKIKAELFNHQLVEVDVFGKIHFEASKLDCPVPLHDLTILDAEVSLLEGKTIVKGYIDVPLLDSIGIKHLTPIIVTLPHEGKGFIIDIIEPHSFSNLPLLNGDFIRIDHLGPHLLHGLGL